MLLQDQRYRSNVNDLETHHVEFSAACFTGSMAKCRSGATRTFRNRGITVYWDGTRAWRCVRTPKGRLAKITASKTRSLHRHPTKPPLPTSDLVAVVASAKLFKPT
jgi:hypothetical protein